MKRSLPLLFLIPLLFTACKTTQRVTKSNLAYIYFNEPTVIHPEYKVYHQNDDLTSIYIRVKSSEILYSKNNAEKVFMGKMVFQAHVYGLKDNKLISSDTVYMYENTGPAENKYLIGKLDVKLPFGGTYLAEMSFDDVFRTQYVQNVVVIDKSDEYSEENYLVTNEKGEVQFGNSFDPGSVLYVESNRDLGSELRLVISDPDDNLPPPPFVLQENYTPSFTGESDKMIQTKDKRHFQVELGEAGIYHLPDPIDGNSGLTFLVFHSYYPYVKTVSSMLSPLRYITTKQEFEQMLKSENPKKDIDEFWLKISGNPERAADVISEYYSRVELANKHFTSYTQGWKTDRGLIYIVYGQPTSIVRNGETENWLYTEKSNVMTAEFIFVRVDNALTKNDYVLNRSGNYKSSWYRAIDNWRQGRIY